MSATYLCRVLCQATDGVSKGAYAVAKLLQFTLFGIGANTSHGFRKELQGKEIIIMVMAMVVSRLEYRPLLQLMPMTTTQQYRPWTAQ